MYHYREDPDCLQVFSKMDNELFHGLQSFSPSLSWTGQEHLLSLQPEPSLFHQTPLPQDIGSVERAPGPPTCPNELFKVSYIYLILFTDSQMFHSSPWISHFLQEQRDNSVFLMPFPLSVKETSLREIIWAVQGQNYFASAARYQHSVFKTVNRALAAFQWCYFTSLLYE